MSDSGQVKQLIERLQEKENFPAISEHISELSSKAAPSSDSSASELAALILRDYSLTSRLLKVANSAMYGQFSGNISTISRAVVVLGFEQVQLTSAGLIFFEQLKHQSRSRSIKHAVLGAFLSGILARELARKLKLKGWENFFIGAMFHNFGRILALYYFPEEYARFCELFREGKYDETSASRQALGASFTELGIAVAKSWSLPDQIIVSMKLPSEEELQTNPKKANHQQILPRLANELCDITMNASPADRRVRLLRLLQKYKKLYPLRQNEILNMLDEAIKEMHKFADVLRLDRADLEQLDQYSYHAEEDEAKLTATAVPALKRFTVNGALAEVRQLSEPEERQRHLQSGIQEVTNVLLEDFSLDEVLSMILETIYRGIGFDRVIIFVKDPRSETMLARYGLGPSAASITKGFGFPLSHQSNDLFNLAIRDNQDLYVGDITADELGEHCPEWFQGAIFTPSLALYPIIINKKPVGLIFGGHFTPGELLDSDQLAAVKTLRNQAALAIKQSFSGAA